MEQVVRGIRGNLGGTQLARLPRELVSIVLEMKRRSGAVDLPHAIFRPITPLVGQESPIFALWAPSTSSVTAGFQNGNIMIWDLETPEQPRSKFHFTTANIWEIVGDRSFLAVAYQGSPALVFDAQTGLPCSRISLPLSYRPGARSFISPEGNMTSVQLDLEAEVLYGAGTRILGAWNIRTGHALFQHTERELWWTIRLGHGFLFSGQINGLLCSSDPKSGKAVARFGPEGVAHRDRINAINTSIPGIVISGSIDHRVVAWDIRRPSEPFAEFEGHTGMPRWSIRRHLTFRETTSPISRS